jgi:hypothetical protein
LAASSWQIGRFYGVRPLLPAMIFAEWWWPQIPCHLAALQGLLCLPWGANPPFWTLGYEWGLYLIAPAIFGALLVPMLPWRRGLSCLAVAIVFAALTWWNPDWPTWFAFWMLGAIASRVFRTGFVGLPAGLAGLLICAVALVVSRTALVPQLSQTGASPAGSRSRSPIRRSCDGRRACARSRAGQGFSYSLYAIHLPVCVFIGALMERFAGWPPALVQPDFRGLLALSS